MAGALESIRGPRALPGPRALLLGAAFLGGLAALAAGAGEGGRLGVACGSLLVIGVAAPTVWRLRTDPLDAPGVYALVAAITLGAFSLLWLGSPHVPAPGIGPSEVSHALLMVAAGIAAFGVGVRLTGRARKRPPLELPASAAPPRRVLVGLFTIGAVGLAAGLALGALGYTADVPPGSRLLAAAQAITQLAALGLLAVAICALAAFGGARGRYVPLLAILLCLQVLGGFAAGFKAQSIIPAVLVIFCFVACRLRIPWRAIAIGVVATAVVLAPANYVYRHFLKTEPAGARSRPLGDTFSEGASYFLSTRLRLIDDVAVIDARTPTVYPYGGGRRYIYLPAIILVPRALWANKPVLDDGLQFSHTYWQIPSTTRTLTPITQPGDLLRNFGVAGLLVGMALWGVALGAFTAVCRERRSPRTQLVYLVALATAVLFVETDLPEVLAGAARTLPVAAVVAWAMLPGRDRPAGYRRVLTWLRDRSGAGPMKAAT